MHETLRASAPDAFAEIPKTAAGHFALYLYAAVFRLIHHLHVLAEAGGTSLEPIFERYPFLAEYGIEIHRHMGAERTWGEGLGWWDDQIARWESSCQEALPLRDFEESGRGRARLLAFMTVGLVEEDSRFGTLYAELQESLGHRRPTLEFLGRLISTSRLPGDADAWAICRPLIEEGWLTAQNRDAPRAEWVLKVPPLLWDAARGEVAEQPFPGGQVRPFDALPAIADLVAPEDLLRRLERLPEIFAAGQTRTVVLRSPPGTEPLDAMAGVARALGRSLLAVDAVAPDATPPNANGPAGGIVPPGLGPLAVLGRLMPVFSFDLAPGETASLPQLAGYGGPRGLVLGPEGGLAEDAADGAVTLHLGAPNARERERFWRQAMAGRPLEDLGAIVDRFQLGGGHIRRAAEIAVAQAGLDGREAVHPEDVREAARLLGRQMLDTLATYLPSGGTWSDLITSGPTHARLDDLERRCRHRERLLGHLGRGFSTHSNKGVRALFTGSSGTGKTLAARILAAELGMDLYRVDLAAVVNKYIGETEKNLHRVLSRAEALDVVLLLDEGDALLGSRTEVKGANDRYANLETNYLLQRLEHYNGIVVVTTNLGDNIDSAFQRRMDVVVPFFAPGAEERLRILELHLPDDHTLGWEDLERFAVACDLTGGQLRNVALNASLLALEDGSKVLTEHLEEALRGEYRKAGAACPLVDPPAPAHGGVAAFMTAFGRQTG